MKEFSRRAAKQNEDITLGQLGPTSVKSLPRQRRKKKRKQQIVCTSTTEARCVTTDYISITSMKS